MNSPFDDENSLEENKSERLKTIRVDYEDQRYHEIPFDFFVSESIMTYTLSIKGEPY